MIGSLPLITGVILPEFHFCDYHFRAPAGTRVIVLGIVLILLVQLERTNQPYCKLSFDSRRPTFFPSVICSINPRRSQCGHAKLDQMTLLDCVKKHIQKERSSNAAHEEEVSRIPHQKSHFSMNGGSRRSCVVVRPFSER